MPDIIFFYGTLMSGFERRARAALDDQLTYLGRGMIRAALFDLGPYPAAVPAAEGKVWGETYGILDTPRVLSALDRVEGYRPDEPNRSLYRRSEVEIAIEDGRQLCGWVYFYNAPVGGERRIPSGDYREYLRTR